MRDTRHSGFTIVEVLIVLAVAGLILMLTLQAIPTLQRNNRNNQRKQDVSAVLQAVSRYTLSNSGAMPDDCGGTSDLTDCTAPDGPLQGVNFTYYHDPSAASDVSIAIKSLASGDSAPAPGGQEKIVVYNYQRCDPDSFGQATSDAAGSRDVVALYFTENGDDSFTQQCMQL